VISAPEIIFKGATMKSVLISLFTLFTIFSFSASASIKSFNCEAQMIGLNEDGVSVNGLIAPYLVARDLNALIDAKHTPGALLLNYNPEGLNSERGAFLILDGRGKMMMLNVHVTAKATGNAVKVIMTDRLSNTTSEAIFKKASAVATAAVSTKAGSLLLTCKAN